MANPITTIDGEDRLNAEVITDYVCDACYGELTQGYDPCRLDGQARYIVLCMNDPINHHGFIKRGVAYFRDRKEVFRAKPDDPD